MPFHDLNVSYTTNHVELSNILAFQAELGYSVVAVTLLVTSKLPAQPQIIPTSELTVPPSISKVLTRLTITISDSTQNHRLSHFFPHYDLLALRPTNEKALQLCCNSLDCDIISLDCGQRLPFILKFKTVASALQRGVRLEICYGPGISASSGGNTNDARRNLIANAGSLIRATRGRGIILSSEAKNALSVRGPHDVMNLAQVWGLGQERGKEALCEEAAKVVRLAGIKRSSFRGVIDVIDGGVNTEPAKAATNVITSQTKGVQIPQKEVANGTKRKASAASLNGPPASVVKAAVDAPASGMAEEDKPISKREQKRRAKKARFEAKTQGKVDADG